MRSPASAMSSSSSAPLTSAVPPSTANPRFARLSLLTRNEEKGSTSMAGACLATVRCSSPRLLGYAPSPAAARGTGTERRAAAPLRSGAPRAGGARCARAGARAVSGRDRPRMLCGLVRGAGQWVRGPGRDHLDRARTSQLGRRQGARADRK